MRLDLTVLNLGSLGAACSLAALAASPRLRERFQAVFSLPTPTNQAVVKPFDSIRGLAALWVAMFHSWQWLQPANDTGIHFMLEQGPLAVAVFVTISAFLIYRTLKPISGPRDVGAYLARRWLRIYPLYFVTVVFALLAGYAGAAHFGFRRVAAELCMARLWGYPAYLNPPAWSLYVEEGFYLLVPAWFFVFRKRAVGGSLATYAAASIAYELWPRKELGLVRFFCVGILLSEVIHRPLKVRERFKWAILATGLGLGFITLASQTPHKPYYYFHFPVDVTDHMFAVGVFCMLWSAVNIRRLNVALSVYPLRFLGIISYSVYLWHSLLVLAGTPLVFDGVSGPTPANLGLAGWTGTPRGPVSFLLVYASSIVFYGAVSYALIERPFLGLRARLRGRATMNAKIPSDPSATPA